ncbi:MAG: hypothetical protein IT343_19375 [Candidatus Melainabacteria bacterium]|jgi:hypothetical protein|nr:hypothetical protein [Candidatus Melainabacteria bacterium]
MSRFWQSFFYGLIVTISIMGPTFGFGVLWMLGTGGDAVAFAADCIKLSFVVMLFSTWGLYELHGMLERANRPRSEDRDHENRDRLNQDGRNRDGKNPHVSADGEKNGKNSDDKTGTK